MEENLKDINPVKDIQQSIDVRYKLAAADYLEQLRRGGDVKDITDVLKKHDCLLPENPTEEEIASWRKFREEIYPALPRLKDLRAKALEAIHAKKERLEAETLPNLTQLLKTLDHDIEEITKNREQKASTNNIFIFNNDQAQRIAARLQGRDGKVDSYTVEE